MNKKHANRRHKILSFIFLLSFLPSTLVGAAPDEAAAFLRQLPSSDLQGLQGLLAGRSAEAAKAFALSIPEGRLDREEFVGDDYDYQVRSLSASESTLIGGVGGSAQFASQHGGGSHHSPWGHSGHPGWGLKRFAVFAHCVVRSFYLVRFEANNDPDDPLDPGIPDDPLCPDSPQSYLDKAERFADYFFHLS